MVQVPPPPYFQDLEKAGYTRVNSKQPSKLEDVLRMMRQLRDGIRQFPVRQPFGSVPPPKYGRQVSDSSSSSDLKNEIIRDKEKNKHGSMEFWTRPFRGLNKKPSRVTSFGSDDKTQKEVLKSGGSERNSPKSGGSTPLGGNSPRTKGRNGIKNGNISRPGSGNFHLETHGFRNDDSDGGSPKFGGWSPLGRNSPRTKGRNGSQNGQNGNISRPASGDFHRTNPDARSEKRRKRGVLSPLRLNDQDISSDSQYSDAGLNKADFWRPPIKVTGGILEVAKKIVHGDFYRDCLDAHNEYRARHRVPPLKLNPEMHKVSQRWADHLARIGSVMGIYHSERKDRNDYGENVHASFGYKVNGRLAVDNWYAEIMHYDFKTGQSINGEKIGHLTALLWKTSRELGVGYAFSSEGAIFVVCHYNPPGNYEGIFHRNVPPVGGFTEEDMRRFDEEDEKRHQMVYERMQFLYDDDV